MRMRRAAGWRRATAVSDSRWRLVVAWIALNLFGLPLARLARRRDRDRAEKRTGGLWSKYGSYVLITGGTLALGWLPPLGFDGAMLLFLALVLREISLAWVAVERGAGSAAGPRSRLPPGLLVSLSNVLLPAYAGLSPAILVGIVILVAGARLAQAAREREDERTTAVLLYGLLLAAGLAGMLSTHRAAEGTLRWGFLWLVVAITDAYGQLLGQAYGARPLAPSISPTKTLEGLAGGLGSATLLGALLGPALGWSCLGSALAALFLAACSVLGDLAESALKRRLGIKDFSRALGAHGGILDRFDSLLGAGAGALVLRALWVW